MKIKDIEIKNKLILAPMAGVSDVGFRTLCVLSGADYAVCEMVSAKALKYKSKKTADLLITSEAEAVKVAQIFGSDPAVMAEICKSEHLQPFDIIDINMGCPAHKIINNGEGSALMTDVATAESIIKACVAATSKPITVKFRKGWDENSVNAVEFAQMCEKAGASAITIHARTKQQGYSGLSDLDTIKAVKQAVTIPVIGNGDVTNHETFQRMLEYTGCDAVMIGRGALGCPWVFSEILHQKPIMTHYEFIEKHVQLLQQHFPDRFIVKHMRKHFLWYLKGVKHSGEFKQKLLTLTNISEVMYMLNEVINKTQ